MQEMIRRWCIWCIEEARRRGERGFRVILAAMDDCECPMHNEMRWARLQEAHRVAMAQVKRDVIGRITGFK